MAADNLTPWDGNFHRRETDRPSHDAETVGPMRFFVTAPGPGATPYPTAGSVYYAELVRDVTFPKTPGSSAITYFGTGHYEYIAAPNGMHINQGALVKCTKIGGGWYTDAQPCNCPM